MTILKYTENKYLHIEYLLFTNEQGRFGVRTKDLCVNEVLGIKFFFDLSKAEEYFKKCTLFA